MAQQQLTEFLSGGGAEAALEELVTSGQLETMITEWVDPPTVTSLLRLMDNVDMESLMEQMKQEMEGSQAEMEEGQNTQKFFFGLCH